MKSLTDEMMEDSSYEGLPQREPGSRPAVPDISSLQTSSIADVVKGEKVTLEEVGYPMIRAPYRHQYVCWKESRGRRNFAIFMEMGTGKSKVAVDTAAYLFDQGKITGILVVAPKGVYSSWQFEHFPEHLPKHIGYTLCRWSSAMNKKELKNAKTFCKDPKKLHVMLMNVEALVSKKHQAVFRRFCDLHSTMLIIDESVCVKNPQAVRTKFLLKNRMSVSYRRILSGLPMPNGYEDLFSQYELLDPDILRCGSIYGFRNRYCVMKEVEVGGSRKIKVTVSYRNIEDLKKKVLPHTFIARRSDCLDLPDKIYKKEPFIMGPKQAAMYKSMQDRSIVELEELGRYVTASEVIVRLQKLHQIACGFIKSDQKEVPIPDSPRMDTLLNLIDQTYGQIAIWSAYVYNVKEVEKELSKRYGEKQVVTFYGMTSAEDREDAKVRFMEGKCRFFLGTKAGGRGLNFQTHCNQTVYYSSDYDQDFRKQSEDRIHRIGQTKICVYTDIYAVGSEDENILKAQAAKERMSDAFLTSNWRSMISTGLS